MSTPPADDIAADVTRVGEEVRKLVIKGKFDATSALSIVRGVARVCVSLRVKNGCAPRVVQAVVVDVAKGKDGILGTRDDLINPTVLRLVNAMTQSPHYDDLTSLAVDAAPSNIWSWIMSWFC